MSTYALIDSIDQLSHRPDYPWCTTPKEALGEFIGVTRQTVYRAIEDGLAKGLLERDGRGDLRSTEKWINEVRLYDTNSGAED